MRAGQCNPRFARLEHAPGARHDLLPSLGQGDVLGLALNELHSQVVLQFLELGRQCRLADEALFGRAPEMPRIGHRDQVAQVLQLDIHTLAHGLIIYEAYRNHNINRLELYAARRHDARHPKGRTRQLMFQELLKMLGIGQKFPQFSLTGVVSSDLKSAFQPFTQDSFPGKWQVVFFWPKDFTFVCPTEIAAFGKLEKEFKARDAQILGVSIDSEFVHLAWRRDKDEVKNLPFPRLADIKRELTTQLGILDPEAGVAQRATYIVDPQGVIRFVYVTELNVGRNPEEVLRVLDALQTDELCPCNWKQGEDTLQAA